MDAQLFKMPDLLRKRLSAHEEEREQRAVLALSALMFVISFIITGLGFRLGIRPAIR